MSVLVIDNMSERKAAIEHALSRSGILLTNYKYSNSTNLLDQLNKSTIVILMTDSQKIDWDNPVWQPVLQSLIMIGPESILEKKSAKETWAIPVSIEDKSDQIIPAILKLVMHWVYRDVFPITVDKHMQDVLSNARKAAKSSASILIEGETGTGKEVIAQYIHHHSTYSNGPFVAVNCAAIPETMIEAILFGYEKGAFTNAINSYVGKFEQANYGTLFLDEIAEMSTEMQAKLLRVLQENEIERIGSRYVYKVDIRIIAATNQNLILNQKNGNFRSDLYYRLNVVNLKCPPLRSRFKDINALAVYYMKLYSQQLKKDKCEISHDAISYLEQYSWPGNVRELQNVIHRAVIMDDDGVIDNQDLGPLYPVSEEQNNNSLHAKEAETIVNALKEAKGCRSDAAKRLMISPRTLRYKISKLIESGFDVPRRMI